MPHPIPAGYRSVTPSLVIKGAAEAIDFYKRAFGAEEVYRFNYPGPDGAMQVAHAEIRIGDSLIFLGDEAPAHGAVAPTGPSPVTIHLCVTDADASFNRAVEAGATVRMPLENMFWGDRYGTLTDPFGHHWAIAEHVEDVSPEEMQKRLDAMCGGGETAK